MTVDKKTVEQLVEIITREVLLAMLEQQSKAEVPRRRAVQAQLRRWLMRQNLL